MRYLEELRQVISLRAYGQKDPLNEYKKESFGLFENLLKKVKLDLISFLNNLNIVEKIPEENSQNNVEIPKRAEELNKKGPNCLLILNKNKKIFGLRVFPNNNFGFFITQIF